VYSLYFMENILMRLNSTVLRKKQGYTAQSPLTNDQSFLNSWGRGSNHA
jgi:hypothetical protein